jgi:hypothetical protein
MTFSPSNLIACILFCLIAISDVILARMIRKGLPYKFLYLGNPKSKKTGEYLYEINKWRRAASYLVFSIAINSTITALVILFTTLICLLPLTVLMVVLYLHGAWLITSLALFLAYCDTRCYHV